MTWKIREVTSGKEEYIYFENEGAIFPVPKSLVEFIKTNQ